MLKTKAEVMKRTGAVYRNKLIIQKKVLIDDEETQEKREVWADYLTWNCNLMLDGGKEFWAAQKNNAEISGLAQGPYIAGKEIDRTMQAVYNGKVFGIDKAWMVDKQNKIFEIHLKKVG